MGKTAELSLVIRSSMVAKFNAGTAVKDIANEFHVSRQTVHYQINKFKKYNDLINLRRSGAKRKTTPTEDRGLLREFKKNIFLKPQSAANNWNLTAKNTISERTVRRRLKEEGLKTYKVKDVPYISKANKLKRLAFAKEHLHKPKEFWRSVLWTDESSFEYNSSKNKFFVRLPTVVRHKKRPVFEKVSHGGGSVMFWGCVAYNGLGDLVPITGSMNQHQYLSTLNDTAFPNGDRLIGESFILQQDNAPCHKSRMITNFLKNVGVGTLDWPPQSPDLNIIENVWSLLKRKRTVSLNKTREETISEVTSLWKEISPEVLQNLVDSVPRRLQKVIEAKGGYTFY